MQATKDILSSALYLRFTKHIEYLYKRMVVRQRKTAYNLLYEKIVTEKGKQNR